MSILDRLFRRKPRVPKVKTIKSTKDRDNVRISRIPFESPSGPFERDYCEKRPCDCGLPPLKAAKDREANGPVAEAMSKIIEGISRDQNRGDKGRHPL